jgi:hypothetical protein
MANEVDMGREKCLIKKVGSEPKNVEDHWSISHPRKYYFLNVPRLRMSYSCLK